MPMLRGSTATSTQAISTWHKDLDPPKSISRLRRNMHTAESELQLLSRTLQDMSCSKRRLYEYRPLHGQRSIRLLKLFPGPVGSPLRCRMLEMSLDERTPYEAISYTWGSPERVNEVICRRATIRITSNCAEVLQRLRCSERSRLLWIDAICIDQDSPQERNHQVAMMSEVYSKASCVIVWLGEGDADTDAAIKYIKRSITIRPFKLRDLVYSSDPIKPRFKHIKEGDLEVFRQLNTFFQKAWFDRVWTVQEVALARQAKVLCGDSSLRLKDLMIFLKYSEEYLFMTQSISRVSLHRHMWRYVRLIRRDAKTKRVRITNCTDLLLRTRPQNATDPRDKIIAFHGLLTLLGVRLPIPDYAKSVSEIYREAAASMIRHDNSLDILLGLTGATETQQLPSWVPDWSDTRPITPLAELKHDLFAVKHPPRYGVSADNTILTVWGVKPDAVAVAACTYPAYQLHAQKNEATALQEWISIFCKPPGSERRMLEFFVDFAHSRTRHGMTVYLIDDPWRAAILDLANAGGTTDSSSRRNHESRTRYQNSLRKLLDRKIMFRTKCGRLGIASHFVRAGDDIALFPGCRLPMIIRPAGRYWRCVAPAYIENAMCGASAYSCLLRKDQATPSFDGLSLQAFSFI